MVSRLNHGKKRTKWFKNPIVLTLIGLIGGAILSFLASYYFTIREENINRSRLISNINYAEGLLDQGMPQDALKKYQELLTKVSKEVEPQLYARIKTGVGLSYSMLAYSTDQEQKLRNAIAAYEKALDIFTLGKSPDDYAKTQGYLANAYLAGVS